MNRCCARCTTPYWCGNTTCTCHQTHNLTAHRTARKATASLIHELTHPEEL